jgi:aryl-alcohol dehydrogenase-like predicted oxidoreductase
MTPDGGTRALNLSSTAEEIIGEWFAATGRRSEIFLATKFGAADLREGPNKGKTCSDPEYIKHAFKRSLKLLQTDHVDLYYQVRERKPSLLPAWSSFRP